MSFFEAIVLGIVQGLTEFLPISSSGHLRIVPAIAGWPEPGAAFTAIIQLGTMAAVVLYFRKDIFEITTAFMRGLLRRERPEDAPHIRMGWYLGLGTVPIVVFGFLFSDQIENEARNLYLIGGTLIVLGILLGIVDATAKHVRQLDSIKPRDAAIVGFAQALALIPGVSRSGSTITFALLRGFSRQDAARFSFLLSIPAVVLSGVYELKEVGTLSDEASISSVIVATIAAFISGYLAIAFLIKWLGEHSMAIFVGYRIVLGVLVIALTASGSIS